MIQYIKQIQNHGFGGFAKKVMYLIDSRLFKSAISYTFYKSAMASNKVYLGNYISANQGTRRRHPYMSQVAEKVAKEHDKSIRLEFLEIGTYAGASALVWGSSINKFAGGNGRVTCVDPWESFFNNDNDQMNSDSIQLGVMAIALKEGKVRELFQHNIKVAGIEPLVRPLKGFFKDVFPTLKSENNKFHLIYIDADHSYSSVMEDLTMAASLLAPDGILCGDDLEMQFSDVDAEFCLSKSELDFVVDPKTKTFYHPGVSRAVYEFFGSNRVSAWNGFWAMRKNASGGFSPVSL